VWIIKDWYNLYCKWVWPNAKFIFHFCKSALGLTNWMHVFWGLWLFFKHIYLHWPLYARVNQIRLNDMELYTHVSLGHWEVFADTRISQQPHWFQSLEPNHNHTYASKYKVSSHSQTSMKHLHSRINCKSSCCFF